MTKTPTEEAVESIKADLAETCPPGSRYSHALVNKRHLSHLLSELSRLQAERDRAVEACSEAEVQITYLHEKFGETGSGNAVLAKLRGALLAAAREDRPPQEGAEPVALDDAKLPCDVTVAHITFKRGVGLKTFVDAATRWHAKATATFTTPPATQARIEALTKALVIREVATIPIEHPFGDEKTPPVWYLEVGGYVAQFDHEQAAQNFRNAIIAALHPKEGADHGG